MNYNVLYECYLGVLLLFDVLDKIKDCLVTATIPYYFNEKGTASKMTSQHYIVS